MFESLLLKILQKQLDQFILGLDSKNLNLGVWSGNVVIENVAIKPEVLEMFEIPIRLKFSSIGKLTLQVPWSSLSSSPVEIFLEKVFIIIGAKDKKDWKFVDYNIIMKQMELIENYAKACIQKFIEKEKSLEGKGADQAQAGYFEKLTMRIVDNLQISVKSIHVRFENDGPEISRFSWGITLDKIEIFTTDLNWTKNFIDRTDVKNKNKPMNKLLNLSYFTIYWNSQEKYLLGDKSKAEIMDSLDKMIKREKLEIYVDHVISISAQMKLIQKTQMDSFTIPEFLVSIDLDAIDTKLKKSQLQEIIVLIDYFNVYHNKLMEKRRIAAITSESERLQHEKTFIVLYDKIQKTEKKTIDILSESEKQVFQEILSSEPIEELFIWVKNVLKTIQKDQKMLEMEQKKIKENQGWFGGWWGGGQKSSEELISGEERESWDKFYEENFSDESMDMKSVMRPPDYIWFQLDFKLKGGSIQLSSIGKEGNEEGIRLVFGVFKANLLMRDKNKEFKLSLMSFGIDLTTLFKGADKEIITIFLKKNELIVSENEESLNLIYQNFPISVPEEEVIPDTQIDLIVKSAKVVYNPLAIKRLIDFFDVKVENDELKDNAWKQIEKLNDATQKSMQQVMQAQAIMKINILMESPYIIVPFKHNNDPEVECWLFNLGTLVVKTNNKILDKKINKEEKIYDCYDLQLKDIKMEYFPSVSFLNKFVSSQLKDENAEIFKIIPNFNINLSLSLLKSALNEIVKDKPGIEVKGSLPSLEVDLNPKIYQKIIKIADCFDLGEGPSIEIVQTEKSILLSNNKKIGEIWKRGKGMHIWSKHYGILSGSYIYFFDKVKDLQYQTYVYVRNSLITRVEESQIGMKNAFLIQNRYGNCYFACEKEENTVSWIDVISKCQDETIKKEAKKLTNQEQKEDYSRLKTLVNFELENINLNLSDNNNKIWLSLQTNSLKLELSQYAYTVICNVSLQALELEDPLREYLNPSLKKFITCSDEQNKQVKKQFLNVSIVYTDKKHPEYNKVDLDVDVKLGSLYVNFKPNTLLEVFAFLQPEEQELAMPIQKTKELKHTESVLESQTNTIFSDNEEIIILRAKIHWERISLTMVHRKTHCSVAQIKLEDSSISFIQKIDEMNLEGQLGNLQLIDLSNYPKTIYQENQWKQVQKHELLGAGDAGSLLKIKFTSFTEGSLKIKDGIASIAKIDIQSVKIDFMMQPIFRILDYTLVQMLGSLTTPDLLDKRLKKAAPIGSVIETKSIRSVLRTIKNAKIMQIIVNIEKPVILLKASPDSQDYLCIDLGQIRVESDRKKLKDRIPKDSNIKCKDNEINEELDGVLCDYFKIWMNDMRIKIFRKKEVFEMSKPYHFNLEVERLIFQEEYQYCYDLKLDNSMRIKSRIFPIILSLFKADYLLIMKILFANISYDDMMDRYYIHDYNVIPIEENKAEPSAPIDFKLDIDNITLFVMDDEKPNNYHLPFARIFLQSLRIQFQRDSSKIIHINVKGDQLGGSSYYYYISRKNNQKLKEKTLFGDYFQRKKHLLKSSFDLNDLNTSSEISEKYTPDFQFTNQIENNPNLDIILTMNTTGYKEILLNLTNIRVNTHAGILYQLSGFATMDNSVTPPEPIGLKILEIQNTVSQNAIVKNEGPSGMKIQINIQNILVIIGAKAIKNVLALKGAMKISFQTNPSKTFKELEKEIEENKQGLKEPFYYELNPVMTIVIQMIGLELFICEKKKLIDTIFGHIKKRSILLPFDCFFRMNSYLAWTEQKIFYNKGKNKVSLNKTVFLISYNDINDLKTIMFNQLEFLYAVQKKDLDKQQARTEKSIEAEKKLKAGFNKVVSKIKQEKILNRTVTVKKEVTKDDILGNAKNPGDIMKLSDTDFEIVSEGFQLIIVNDAGDAFIPVLEFKVYNLKAFLKKNLVFMSLSTPLSFSATYYNPQASRWEPIIERCNLMIDFSSNTLVSPHMLIHIETKEGTVGEKGEIDYDEYPFNLNISTQLINVLLKTFSLMNMVEEKESAKKIQTKETMSFLENSKFEEKKEASMIKEIQEEKREYVSPYTIRNETGYTIEIIRQGIGNKPYVLENREVMNFQIETSKDEMFSLDQDDVSKLTHNIKIDVFLKSDHLELTPVTGIDLNRVRLKRYRLFTKDKNAKNLSVISEVGLDKNTNRKLIIISSPLVLSNTTAKELEAKILISNDQSLHLILPAGKSAPIPIDLINKQVIFKFSETQNWSELCSLQKMIENSNGTTHELKLDKYFSIVRICKESKGAGKTVVYFEPPYLIKNALPVNMKIQFFSNTIKESISYTLCPQEEFHEYEAGLSSKLFFKIIIPGFFWSDEARLYSPNTEFCKEIKLKDVNGKIGIVNIHHVESFVGSKQFFFYTKGYLINESTYDLVFFGVDQKNKKKELLAGHLKANPEEDKNKDLILFNDQTELEVAERKTPNLSCKPFSLASVGDNSIEFNTNEGYLHLGVTTKLLCVDTENHIFTKVISFTPRYVFVNMLNEKMGIRQSETEQCFVIIEKDREPYKFENPMKPKKIRYTAINKENQEWNWSGDIDINAIGLINFVLRSKKDPHHLRLMKGDIRNDQGLIYIIIDEYKDGSEPYVFENKLDNFKISFIQESNTHDKPFQIDKKDQKLPFGWDYPCGKKEVKLKIESLDHKYEDITKNITIDKIDSKLKFELSPFEHGEKYPIIIQTIIENSSKKIIIKKSEKIYKKKEINLENKENPAKKLNIEFQFGICLSHLGISLIQNTGKKTLELLYVTFYNLEFCLIDTKKLRTLQTRIKYFNIDNNNTHLVNFPVLLTPTEHESCLKTGKYFLNVVLEKSLKQQEVTIYNSIKFEIEPLTIKIEDSLINVVLEFYNALYEILWSEDKKVKDDPNMRYFYHLNKQIRPKLWFWEIDEIPISNQQTFIDDFLISPLKLNLTFITKSKGSDLESGFAVFAMFFKALGVALANIDDAPIKLTGLRLENCFDTTSGITTKLISHYKQNITTEVFKLLGSINIIGNPVGLFSQLGTGVSDLFEKPAEGFVKGPLEGGVGIVKGAGSLLKHTFAGTFNSIDKITGSLGTGLAALSLDDEYLAEREKMKMTKAKHVGEGLKQGAMSIFTGFQKGITGVFLKPMEGASKGGVKGFLKGTVQGITGLVFKPISGILDATSKAAEGIKNTATTFDDKPNDKRERLIRVFYGMEKFYKSWERQDAELNYFLQVELKKGRYANNSFIGGYVFKQDLCLFVSMEHIILFNKAKMKKEWDIVCDNLEKVEKINGNSLKIIVKIKPKKWQENNQILNVPEGESLEGFYSKFEEILEIKQIDLLK